MNGIKSVAGLSGMASLILSGYASAQKMNVLFIAVDDLKPVAGCYGDPFARTPGIDRLAREGVVFVNAYCQQAISAASRASLLTGMYPDKTRVWDLVTDFRQVNPNAVSLPQYFRKNGYETAGMGKIFHNESAGPGHDAPSWSVPYRNSRARQYYLPFRPNEKGRGPSTECADVPDNTYRDGQITEMAVSLMDSLSRGSKPFFLAVGYLKPHLPFVAPKKYWDLYDRNRFEVAPFQKKALNSPDIAYHVSGELKNYSDIPQFDSYSDDELMHLSVEKQKELIHGYYAAMSYTDAQIMRLLDELDRLGIRKNTIIVLWGDHGWHLGDHGLWNKHTNLEQSTHALMMMSIPGEKKDIKPVTLAEFTDIFPTLCDIVDIPAPRYLDGVSLLPSIKKPEVSVRSYAFMQYPRGEQRMGYSIRTERYRYTVWLGKGFRTWMPFDSSLILAREMYDYVKDPLERESILDDPEYGSDRLKLEKLFLECMARELRTCRAYADLADYREPISTAKK